MAGPPLWGCPPAAMLIWVASAAAAAGDSAPVRSPLDARRLSIATQRGSFCLSMKRMGEAMKIEE